MDLISLREKEELTSSILLACGTLGKRCLLIHFSRVSWKNAMYCEFPLSYYCYFSQEATIDFFRLVCRKIMKTRVYLQSNGFSKYVNQPSLQLCHLALIFSVLQKTVPIFPPILGRESLLRVKISFIIRFFSPK